MNLLEKAAAVEGMLHELDEEIKKFQDWSSLKCKVGCGKCCTKPDIEATPLEFLPLAKHIWNDGKADSWIASLESNSDSKVCHILNPHQQGIGHCTEYLYRGMICRLFGFSARLNKYGRRELLTCSTIKTEQSENYQVVQSNLFDSPVPMVSNYYSKLSDIDPVMAQQFMPINKAILQALQLLSQYVTYLDQES